MANGPEHDGAVVPLRTPHTRDGWQRLPGKLGQQPQMQQFTRLKTPDLWKHPLVSATVLIDKAHGSLRCSWQTHGGTLLQKGSLTPPHCTLFSPRVTEEGYMISLCT